MIFSYTGTIAINNSTVLQNINVETCHRKNFLIGNNGSGKSLFFKSIFSFSEQINNADRKIFLFDENVSDLNSLELFERKIFFLPQFVPKIRMSYFELYYFMYCKNHRKKTSKQEFKQLIVRTVLKYNLDCLLLDKQIGSVSGGEQKVMELIVFSLLEKRALFIDEIDSGVDATNKKTLADIIVDFDEKCFIFIISHDMLFLQTINCSGKFRVRDKKIETLK